MDAAQRSLRESVGRDQSQAEHAHPVDAVDGLRERERESESEREGGRERQREKEKKREGESLVQHFLHISVFICIHTQNKEPSKTILSACIETAACQL